MFLNASTCRVFWICALLFNGCLATPKGKFSNDVLHVSSTTLTLLLATLGYRYRSQSQNKNIGDDADDERLISPGSESEDGDQKPAARNPPTRGSSQQNVQTRPGSQAAVQLNHAAQGSAANEALVFPLRGPAQSQRGAVNQQSPATGFANAMPPSSSWYSVYAPQSGGQSQHSRAPEAKGLVFEEVFQFGHSGPAQHHAAGRGYDYGRNSMNFGSHGSPFDARFPFYQRGPAQPSGPSGVVYRNLAPAVYNEGLNSNGGEAVPQEGDAQVIRRPPPSYKPVYVTQSRHGYSLARYTHSHSNYSPELNAPMPVDPRPQDAPVVREETHRYGTSRQVFF